MTNYVVAEQVNINEGIRLFLLNISDNTGYRDNMIVPQTQTDELNRYKIKRDADKRILARAFLYEYLHKQIGITDFGLNFNQYKKPFLKAAPFIDFSFSYAGEYVLVAVSEQKKIGADIEEINPALDLNELAPEIMCPGELQQFNSYLPGSPDQSYFFFNLFSAKESIIKCFGTGLYFDVKKLNVLAGTEYDYLGTKYIQQQLGIWMNKYSLSLCYEK